MAYTVVDKGSKYFNTLTYTGDASSPRTITGVGFKPDFTWIKNRTRAGSSALNDNVRGVGTGVYRELSSETTNNEGNNGGSGYGYLSAFASDGFTLTTGSTAYDIVNRSGDSYVSWNWLADNTSGSSNTQGSITSTVSVNTTAGFSIVSWAGNQTAGASCGHGLGVAPSMIIKRRRNGDNADYWYVYHKSLGSSNSVYLNDTSGSAGSGAWNSQTPTSTVFYHGSSIRENGNNMIAYCFADVKGFSKFGSYTGNGSTDGTFVYTGFKPAFIMTKITSTTGKWFIQDNKRDGYNATYKSIIPNDNGAEDTNSSALSFDFLSNGFKLRNSYAELNPSGGTIIYMAFAENPFVSSKAIPCTAK